MYNLTDQTGISHTFLQIPKRIISLVPSQTELLADLGLEDKIVGLTKFCVHPDHLKLEKTVVGGTKNVNFEKIKALQPDIIICNKEENTRKIVLQLSEICTVWVTNVITMADNLQMIKDFGDIFKCEEIAEEWIQNLNFGLRDFSAFIAHRKVYKTAYFIWKVPYMVAGTDTFINQMLKLNHFENVINTDVRYPEIKVSDLESLQKSELILLSTEPYPFKAEDANEISLVFPKAKILLVDGEMFSWHGTRLLKALDYFKDLNKLL